ncbi:MAG: hypothetical protein A2X02_02205 [Bacteroidetes bacterium GWF2_29_10]|nr:MAG: hypothetical protein A2X02_02205 [Bacteroidetes bacterium GWF2_29_10]
MYIAKNPPANISINSLPCNGIDNASSGLGGGGGANKKLKPIKLRKSSNSIFFKSILNSDLILANILIVIKITTFFLKYLFLLLLIQLPSSSSDASQSKYNKDFYANSSLYLNAIIITTIIKYPKHHRCEIIIAKQITQKN